MQKEKTKNRSNNIELELRAEVTFDQLEKLYFNLNKRTKKLSQTRRLSVMFLGKINKSNFDIRVRISSNGKAEIVVKKGDFHVHDRIENSQEITKNQFIGIVKILVLFGFKSKVTERENFEFDLDNNITLVLVKARSIAYVEIEKMSNIKNLEKNKSELSSIVKNFDLKIIKDDKEFNKLCNRLTKYSDWVFDGSDDHIAKLTSMLNLY
ncbi:MAG: hypothetical protein US18_C0008G0003 [Parcubacteria group bacterium GW2011_GWB1_36_5]|nr:MAG: hypothetical protein US18_C0008G0003 [Parcubacteria group bacterium GW2011_GWB1_36_5]